MHAVTPFPSARPSLGRATLFVVMFAALLAMLAPPLSAPLTAPPRFPIRFMPNVGQTADSIRFIGRVGGHPVAFLPDGVLLGDELDVQLTFVGAATDTVEGLDRLPAVTNIFHSRDRSNWYTDIPTFSGIVYRDLYPHIDLAYVAAGETLKSEFWLAAAANAADIHLHYTGVSALEILPDGSLYLQTPHGPLRESPPIAYQEGGGARHPVAVAFVLRDGANGREIGYQLGPYDKSQPLVIDPALDFSTFLGGNDNDYVEDVAVDSTGNIYLTGMTNSTNFPTKNQSQGDDSGQDVFVAKFSPDGTLLYATYLGGSSSDWGYGIAVDDNGSAYVTGSTSSNDFPTVNPFQATSTISEAFVAKLSPAGNSLTYATYLGGANIDSGGAIAVDGSGNAIVTGSTGSLNFPTKNPLQGPQFTLNGASSDAFVTKLNASGSALLFSTYLGGSQAENVAVGNTAVALAADGSIYVAGETRSNNFPVANAFQSTYGGGTQDAFLVRLNGAGSAVLFATYLGGSGEDHPLDLTTDSNSNAVLVGETRSSNFPTTNPYQATYGGGLTDGFWAKLRPNGTAAFSSYFGGNNSDLVAAVALDADGRTYLAGATGSRNFPLEQPLQGSCPAFCSEAFVTVLEADGRTLAFSTYLGGISSDAAVGINLVGEDVVVVGKTSSNNFPTLRPWQSQNAGLTDLFVTRINMSGGQFFLPLVTSE